MGAQDAWGTDVIITLLESVGLCASLVALLVGAKALAPTERVGRSVLLSLVGLLAIEHLANILETFDFVWADTIADQLSVLVPFLWGLYLLETWRGYWSARLAASDEQVRFFLEAVPASVAWLDSDERLLGFTAAWRQRFPNSATGKPLSEAIALPLPKLGAALKAGAQGGLGPPAQLTTETTEDASGKPRYFRWCARSWRHPDHHSPGVLVLLEDFTAEREAEEQRESSAEELARTQRLAHVGQLAAGAAHDFNNFLQVISGALWELSEDARYAPLADEVQQAVDGAREMTRNMLRFGQDEASAPAPVDLAHLLRELQTPLASALGRRHKLELKIAAHDPVMVEGRPIRFQQAILNLAVNARDAMPSGGPIEISLSTEAGEAELSVRDEGSGMSDDVRGRLFTPFFTTKGPRGSGLGLHVVQSVVEEQHGSISVESQLGHGSTFRLRFPLCAESNDVA